MNNLNHPYRNNNNTTKYYQKRKFTISNLFAHYFIHPHSMHNSNVDLFQKPVEIGCLLSQSKYYFDAIFLILFHLFLI